jgi:hypothetical protein
MTTSNYSYGNLFIHAYYLASGSFCDCFAKVGWIGHRCKVDPTTVNSAPGVLDFLPVVSLNIFTSAHSSGKSRISPFISYSEALSSLL